MRVLPTGSIYGDQYSDLPRSPALYTVRALSIIALGLIVALSGCVSVDQTEPGEADEFLIQPDENDGKFDTGYYSNLAMELEGDFEGYLELEVTELNEEERARLISQSYLKLIAEDQVKLAKNQLNEQSLHLNLTAGDVVFQNKEIVERENGSFLLAQYSVVVESLVTLDELKEEGINPKDLEATSHPVIVPLDPRDLYKRVGGACADGYETDSLREHNFFYYFAPEKEGCALPMTSDAQFHVRSLLPHVETFPEYDRLVEDGVMSAAVIFGAYTSDRPPGSDWGMMMWRSYAAGLRMSGWTEVAALSVGQRYTRTKKSLKEVIDLYSPMDLFEYQDTDALFGELLRDNEVIVYNGHSFYGSLDALSQKSYYPEETYQILFMNSCWSYEYYTKQVFLKKATEKDPNGWRDVDVINNTTYAYFPNMYDSTSKLMTNLFAGAENLGDDGRGRRYSWQNMIKIMNDEVSGICPEDADPQDCRHYQPKSKHEIYGVSGVRDNEFTPTRP
jgi:hypothetical protein